MAASENLRNLSDYPVYPGIKKIGWLDVNAVPRSAVYSSRIGIECGTIPEPQWIQTDDIPLLTSESEKSRSRNNNKSKLTFSVREITFPPVAAWVVIDANGCIWLIAGPPPHIGSFTCSRSTSGTKDDPVLWECSVTVPDEPHKVKDIKFSL